MYHPISHGFENERGEGGGGTYSTYMAYVCEYPPSTCYSSHTTHQNILRYMLYMLRCSIICTELEAPFFLGGGGRMAGGNQSNHWFIHGGGRWGGGGVVDGKEGQENVGTPSLNFPSSSHENSPLHKQYTLTIISLMSLFCSRVSGSRKVCLTLLSIASLMSPSWLKASPASFKDWAGEQCK